MLSSSISRCLCIESLYKIHALLIVNGISKYESIVREAVDKYLLFGYPHSAVSFYLSVKNPTLLLQNLVLRIFSNHGYYAQLLSLYAESQNSSYRRPDNYTFPIVIKACAADTACRAGKQAHCAALRSGYGGNLLVRTALVDFYFKIGLLEYARKVFDGITEPDLVSWNALLFGYCLNGFNQDAFKSLREMLLTDLKPNGSIFASVIPLCVRLRAPGLGASLHVFAIKCGILDDEALVPTLISMYSSFGYLSAARMLFEMQKVKDLVSWNSMISAYSQNGTPGKALEVFQLMNFEGERPDFVTMLSVLSSSCDLSDISYGESIHAIVIKDGLASQISVVASLLSMYAKSGELQDAENLFQTAPEKSLLLYNSILSGYLLNGLPRLALATFCEMIIQSVNPDSISLISAISASAMSIYLLLGKSLHAYSIRNGFHSNINVLNALLAFYSECNQFQYTLKLFNIMQARNLVSWNTLICGWTDIGDTQSAVAFFRQIGREDLKFDLITMISILPSIHKSENIALGKSFHALAIKNGFDSDTTLANALISMYANCGSVDDSHVLFQSVAFRSTVSWNALLTGYRKLKSSKEVMKLFNQMIEVGQKPNSVTLLNILSCCEAQIQGKSIHAFALRNFYNLETTLHTSSLCMYARFQNFEYCCRLFGTMDRNNVVYWNTMMSIYSQRKHTEVLNFFKEMLDDQVGPDAVTVLTLVSACSQLGSLDLAQCIHGFIIRSGFERSTSLINSFIDMYAKTGSISTAKRLLDELQEKDLISWSTMINGYGMHGDGEAAMELFLKMQESGACPDDITFVSILSACSHAGLVEEGRIFFKLMVEKHHITPRMEHYACLIDLFSRSGHLIEAFDLVRKLPFKPSIELLESLLGACNCHGDAEVGEAVGKLLIELHPTTSSYVMLSNIYSAAERWKDSGRLRFDMRAKEIRKEPGISFASMG
ncbi:hypothetical protein KFK09_019417 [Dendrobium nobile]|uniref:Pentatricopeptide repeat-containing protein n=1 Tax=Dendrobium nobile TaxID=94219 RepID=A0A8T3AQ73_DENNO|nr:hypothetical protein KFK09_019417 [Dendrobium nobile]